LSEDPADTLADPDVIEVEVVFALPRLQRVVPLSVRCGTTAIEAVRQSGLAEVFPQYPILASPFGVFGERVDAGFVLETGDRVEIYRPLLADPKTVRRELAAAGKTMGRPPRPR
jgi:putative ubiquitin-RnfH superfamily antitoxin RatB of RatAB toxin-antitoxin module